MNDQIAPLASTVEEGVVFLRLQYDSTTSTLGFDWARELVASYELAAAPGTSCILLLTAAVGDSPIIRAIFRLYKSTKARGGRLACVGFPHQFWPSLKTLQMLDHPDLHFLSSLDDAIEMIKGAIEDPATQPEGNQGSAS